MALLNYSIPLSGAGVCINMHVCYVLVVLTEAMRRSYLVSSPPERYLGCHKVVTICF